MMPNAHITDEDRARFLTALSDSARDADGALLSAWETDFVGAFKRSYRNWQFWTPARRAATDGLRGKFGDVVGMPFTLAKTSPVALAPADPTGCEFIIRDEDRRLVRCNVPAVAKNRLGFRYCQVHLDQVQRELARRGGKTLIVERIGA